GYDSLSLCLSKGLGAPVGSLLLGSKDFIARAKRIRKMVGGGMRQAGLLAAAGLHALEHHVERLAEDHATARLLAEGLVAAARGNPALAGRLTVHPVQTNILFTDVAEDIADSLLAHLAACGIRVTSGYVRTSERALQRLRWVTHLDVGRRDVERAVTALAQW